LHDVAKNVEGDASAGVGHVDVIDCAIEGSVGVHITAGFLYFLVDSTAGASGCALEKHVLKDVRESGAEPFALMHAAGHAPGLGGNHGSAVILPHDDSQAIFERGQGDTGGSRGNVFRISHGFGLVPTSPI